VFIAEEAKEVVLPVVLPVSRHVLFAITSGIIVTPIKMTKPGGLLTGGISTSNKEPFTNTFTTMLFKVASW
jgi:hypothetical protein